MEKHQVKGYLLEIVLARLLKVNGYDLVATTSTDIVQQGNGLHVKGRGGYHQFDSLGTFRITPPFVYPIRLFLEAKFHSKKIGIDRVRMGIGILQDVNTNYSTIQMTIAELELPKYNYNYAIFSTSGFTDDAQRLAIAHKIYLMDLSSGYYSWIKDFINQIVDRLFNLYNVSGESIGKDIVNDFKEQFTTWIDDLNDDSLKNWIDINYQDSVISEFKDRLKDVGSIYIASTKSSQIIALIPDNDEKFRESLRENPHQDVTITWNESENSTWIVSPTVDNEEYRLTFQLPPIIQEYIFNNSVNQYDSAYDEKRRSFGLLSFIAYLDNKNPTLCTLKFNEEETNALVGQYNHQLRLESGE
ncbi:TPA: hypothetical protein U1346_001415 [Streptococcus suis]|nr:hypothetical protein [Streptococcus suis]HEM5248808.1 hypothetical protein [Streptococcus suis]